MLLRATEMALEKLSPSNLARLFSILADLEGFQVAPISFPSQVEENGLVLSLEQTDRQGEHRRLPPPCLEGLDSDSALEEMDPNGGDTIINLSFGEERGWWERAGRRSQLPFP